MKIKLKNQENFVEIRQLQLRFMRILV